MIQKKTTRKFVKMFRCWYLASFGWYCFEKKFKNKKHALNYCERRTRYKGSSYVELLQQGM